MNEQENGVDGQEPPVPTSLVDDETVNVKVNNGKTPSMGVEEAIGEQN